MGSIPDTGIKLLMLSLFSPSIFPVTSSRRNVLIFLINLVFFAPHFGQKAPISAFSLFFSLLAGNTWTRTVSVGLRGAPPILYNYINYLVEIYSPRMPGTWRRRPRKRALTRLKNRAFKPANSTPFLGPGIGICHFFRQNLVRMGSHLNRPVRNNWNRMLKAQASCLSDQCPIGLFRLLG